MFNIHYIHYYILVAPNTGFKYIYNDPKNVECMNIWTDPIMFCNNTPTQILGNADTKNTDDNKMILCSPTLLLLCSSINSAPCPFTTRGPRPPACSYTEHYNTSLFTKFSGGKVREGETREKTNPICILVIGSGIYWSIFACLCPLLCFVQMWS